MKLYGMAEVGETPHNLYFHLECIQRDDIEADQKVLDALDKQQMKISELSETQKQHLAWRLDHKTAMGLFTACGYAREDFGDLDLVEVFKRAGRSDHSAKIHARKVINFTLPSGARR